MDAKYSYTAVTENGKKAVVKQMKLALLMFLGHWVSRLSMIAMVIIMVLGLAKQESVLAPALALAAVSIGAYMFKESIAIKIRQHYASMDLEKDFVRKES